MEKHIITFAIVFFLMISLAGAITYKQNNLIDIRHSVRTNGAVTSTALCNITIYDPNWNVLSNYKPMSYSSTAQTFNFTLPSTNTSEVGDYCYDITCSDSGLNQTSNYCIEVTPTGKTFTIAQSITYFLLLIIVIGLFLFALYGSIFIPFRNPRNEMDSIVKINYMKYLKVFSIAMSYMFLTFISYLSWNLAFGYLYLDTLAKYFNWIFTMLMVIALPLLITIAIFMMVIYLQDKKVQGYLERGLNVK